MLKSRHYVIMNVYWFGLAFMWNALHPIILPALLLRFVPDSLKNTYLGGMTFAGLILAMIIQPLSGAWSDRTRSRWGRRRPWMVAGTVATLLVLAGMNAAGGFWVLLITYLLLQSVSNMAHGPAQGLIPDLVPAERRGLASGWKNLFDMAGLIVASLVAGNLMGQDNPGLAFAIIGAVLAVCALTTVVGTPETPGAAAVPAPAGNPGLPSERAGWRRRVAAAIREYPDYAWLIASRFLILLGIYAVQTFAQYFIRDRLAVPNAAEVTGNLMAAIGVALTALVFPAGWLSDRVGRRMLNIGAGLLAALGIFLLLFVSDVRSLYLVGAIIGMATGIFVSVNWALATDLIPADKAGLYMGLTNIATAGSASVSRLGGPLIDGLNAARPGAYMGYSALFIVASVSALAGALLMFRIRRR
ncbi:MAG: MFS transporter [Chloroflexi bacterium]|nr:MFS transporter [Chloroflexota bacterium]